MATPWNLTDGLNPIGFSGTNDLQLLLPGQVKQNDPDLPEFKSTNGRMLSLLQKSADPIEFLEAESGNSIWSRVLDFCVTAKAKAVVDCGSLLAGISNGDAAVYLLDRIDQTFKGVFFFDMTQEKWAVLNREKHVEGRYESPLHERDCFVIFDEARSRGADMKLRIDALAIVTVGPGLTKDKLMQGCGRLRQLGLNQRVQLVGPSEVELSIRKVPLMDKDVMFSTVHVLKWVLENTIKTALSGLSQWARKGLIAVEGQTDLSSTILSIDTSLATMYGSANSERTVAELATIRASVCEREKTGLTEMILERTKTFGSDQLCFARHGHDEECERECEEEKEKEEEAEVKLAPQVPVNELCWDYRIALQCNAPIDVEAKAGVKVFSVAKLPESTPTAASALFRNSPTSLFCTQNFLSTIGDGAPCEGYLRRIDSAFVFPGGEVLLLSALETNGILSLVSAHERRIVDPATSGRLGTECGTSKAVHAACLLYNGGAYIKLNSVFAEIGSMLQSPGDHHLARSIVEARGQEWKFSDVQVIVESIQNMVARS